MSISDRKRGSAWTGDVARRSVQFATCLGGSVVARLASSLTDRGVPSTVVEELSAEEWRQAFRSGPAGRLAARLRSYGAFPVRACLRAIRDIPEVVVATTNPFLLPVALVGTRWLHERPVVVLVYDLYPDALEAAGLLGQKSVLGKAIAAATRYWMAQADAVVFIGDAMKRHAVDRYGEPRRAEVIETGGDPSEFVLAPSSPETDLERFALSGVTFGYVGNMGAMHDWRTLASAGLALARDRSEVGHELRFVVAASGGGADELRRSWREMPSSMVLFSDPLGDRSWARLLSFTDVALVSLLPSADKTSVPSKTFSAMAAGAAVLAIAPHSSDLARLIRDTGAGLVVSPGDVDGLVHAIRRLGDLELRKSMQRAARAAIDQRYGLAAVSERWERLLGDVLHDHAKGRKRNASVQRAFDVIGAGLAAMATGPLLLAGMVAVRASMGSPALFSQQRAGRGGEPFRLRKLRTMRAPRPDEDPLKSDALRLTKTGRLLRSLSIDELPTLLSVVAGDMHLVGPRPLLLQYNSRYSPAQRVRLSVKPGITGWAQINGRNALSWREKFALDAWYVENESFLLDVRILLRTAIAVIRRQGIEAEGHATMPEFMGEEAASSPSPSEPGSADERRVA